MADLGVRPLSRFHMRVEMPGSDRQRGVEACGYLALPRTGELISARAALQAASFLSFLEWVAPSILCHLRPCWVLLTKNGIMEKRRAGLRAADYEVLLSLAAKGD